MKALDKLKTITMVTNPTVRATIVGHHIKDCRKKKRDEGMNNANTVAEPNTF